MAPDRCKAQIRQTRGGGGSSAAAWVNSTPATEGDEGGWAVKRRSDTAETNCSPAVSVCFYLRWER